MMFFENFYTSLTMQKNFHFMKSVLLIETHRIKMKWMSFVDMNVEASWSEDFF